MWTLRNPYSNGWETSTLSVPDDAAVAFTVVVRERGQEEVAQIAAEGPPRAPAPALGASLPHADALTAHVPLAFSPVKWRHGSAPDAAPSPCRR